MQEEVNEKTVALIIRSGKISAEVLKAALVKLMRDMEKSKQKKQQSKAQERAPDKDSGFRGKTTLKKMMQEGSQLTNIEITDNNIKSFEKVARKYGIDYSLKKDRSGEKPRYLVFFRARDADVMTAAFKEYTGVTLTKSKKPSIRKKLQKAINRAAKHREREKTQKREQEQSL